ncbi:hypothetical protein Pcinc_023449 [Petrolisthes cinctipes]|uniref:RRM domain-containing protein n=1 Tax=Petrolisthes cinctipes TaxID=88211 RepID=A0AAE1FFF8_PETCI|nr:hypothetical protein Pcinc_023449 [Petrolisthes cinctipes]
MTSGPGSSSSTASNGNQEAGDVTALQGMSQALKDMLERTKYPLVQENGQRRYGPPPGWEGQPPPKGCEVFVGKIPRDLFEDELVPVMEQAGKVYEVRLMLDGAGTNRGYGFVQYCTRQDAQTALRTLNNYEIRAKRYLGVTRSVDNNRLFVGGIPKTRTREEVLEEMKRVTEGVVKIILYACVNDRTKNRGYAFVEYVSHKAAAMARRRLFSGRILLWNTTDVKVDWAEPELDVDSDVMAKVRILYIRNLALCTTEDDIRNLCMNVGGVERVKKQKDYAFVHFSTREQAERIKADLNGKIVHGCELEITWAKPVKNREEYQQRKAIARSMISVANGQQTSYIPHITMDGTEPVLVVPPVRRAAGTHGMQHHTTRPMAAARTTRNETQLLGFPAPLYIHPETQIKSPTELLIPGFPSAVAAPLQPEKVATTTDDGRGMLQNPSPVPTSSPRMMQTSHALRGPPLTPQYILAPQFCMAPPSLTPNLTAASPQGMAVSPAACMYPATQLTGYESLHPYALHAAYYQQALMGQPSIPTLDRPRYSATGE